MVGVLKNGYFADIKKLQELSGIEPDWQGELKPKVIEVYGRYIEKEYFDRIKNCKNYPALNLIGKVS